MVGKTFLGVVAITVSLEVHKLSWHVGEGMNSLDVEIDILFLSAFIPRFLDLNGKGGV